MPAPAGMQAHQLRGKSEGEDWNKVGTEISACMSSGSSVCIDAPAIGGLLQLSGQCWNHNHGLDTLLHTCCSCLPRRSVQIYNQWKQGFSTNPNPASGGVSSPNDLRAFTRMLLARGVVVGPNGQQRRVLSEASVKEMTTPYPYTNGFGKLVGGSIKQYIPYLEQTKVISPAAAGVLRCVVLGNLWYGLGVPLSQVENGTATNVVLIGGTGQMYVIANFHDPNKALIASASNFQNIIWGYMVSAVVVSEVLTELPQQSLYDSAQMQSACAPVAASSSAALHNQSN